MILESAEFIGIAAFSASGFYIARRNRLDMLGIYILAFLTALGGGITRDIILNKTPTTFIYLAPSTTVIIVVTALLLLRRELNHDTISKPLFVFIDAIGMVSFSISGALLAYNHGFNLPGVAIIAFITAIGGGIFRDILINQIPYVLKGGFYGIIALSVGIIIYLLEKINLANNFTLVALFLLAIALRMHAYKSDWHIPKL